MSFIAISINALLKQKAALAQQKVAVAGFSELLTEPGQPNDLSIQSRRAGDCFPGILENESRK
jgi:hypothetical protein